MNLKPLKNLAALTAFVVVVSVTTGFVAVQSGVYHFVGDVQTYNNSPASDYSTAIGEQPSIRLDGSAGSILVGVGNTTAPITGLKVLGGQPTFVGQLTTAVNQTFTDSDATPDVGGYSSFATNTTTVSITDFDGANIIEGQIIIVESAGAITYDVTSSGLKGGSTDLVTADGDLTVWYYNGTDWLLIAFMDLSDNMS